MVVEGSFLPQYPSRELLFVQIKERALSNCKLAYYAYMMSFSKNSWHFSRSEGTTLLKSVCYFLPVVVKLSANWFVCLSELSDFYKVRIFRA